MSILDSKRHNKFTRTFHNAWRSKVFLRNSHDNLLVRLFGTPDHGGIGFFCGLYFIACDDKIVYIGQSNYIPRRFLESFGPIYHQVADTKLPWSVAFAETNSDANELESTAIRKYAPVFNTSIPNKLKSQGIVPLERFLLILNRWGIPTGAIL